MSFEDAAWATVGTLSRVLGVFGRVAVWVWFWGQDPQPRRAGERLTARTYRSVWRTGQVVGWGTFVLVATGLVALKVAWL